MIRDHAVYNLGRALRGEKNKLRLTVFWKRLRNMISVDEVNEV